MTSNTQKILITGGSGFLGVNLIRFLLQKNPDYMVTNIDLQPFDYPDVADKIETVAGDIRNSDLIAKLTQDKDIIIHCAAALPLYTKEEIFSTDITGTKNILSAAKKNKVSRVIHISSTAVYGVPDHHPLYEHDEMDGVGAYGEAKVAAENLCTQFRKDGLCIPVIRPKSFVGPERLGVFALLYDWAKDGKNFPVIGKGNNRYQLLDVADLCNAIYLTMTMDKNKVNTVFNIGAKEFTTFKEDLQAVLDEAGYAKKVIGFPATPVIFGLQILEKLKLSPLYKWVYDTAAKDSFVSIEKAEKTLGFIPMYSNKEALIRNYHWYLANLDKFQNTSGVTHRVPWKQGALKILKALF